MAQQRSAKENKRKMRNLSECKSNKTREQENVRA